MGYSDWVNEEVNETGEMRWVERDTIDKTGTHQQWSPALTTHMHFTRRAAIPGNLSVQNAFFPKRDRFWAPAHRSLVFRVLISPKTHAMKILTSI